MCLAVPYPGVAQAIFYYRREAFPCVIDLDRGWPRNLRHILAAYRGDDGNPAGKLKSPPWTIGTPKQFGYVSVVAASRDGE
jgi:hypothetical protein